MPETNPKRARRLTAAQRRQLEENATAAERLARCARTAGNPGAALFHEKMAGHYRAALANG